MLTLKSSGRIKFRARNQQVGISLISGRLSVKLGIASSLFVRSYIPVASMRCKVGRIFMCLISFLIKIVFLPPSLSFLSDLYPKYLRKFNFAEGCRRVSFISVN